MRRVFANLLSNWSLLGLNVVAGFVLVPVLLGRLGQEAYGVLVLVNTLAAYTNLLRAGLGGAVVQKVAAARGEGNADGASRSASGVLSLYLLLSILALAMGLLVALLLPRVFPMDPALVRPAQGFAALTALLLALQFPGSVFGGILQGLERYDRANLAVGLGLLLRTAAILAWVRGPEHLVRLGWIQLAAAALEILLAALLARLSWPQLRLGWLSPRSAAALAAGRFGLKNLLLSISERLIYDTDPLVVGLRLGTAPVATWNVGAILARYARMLQTELARVLGPTMSRMHSGGDRDTQRETYLAMTRYALLLALPLVLYGIALGPTFLRLWVGPGHPEAAPVLQILLLPLLFTAPQAVALSVLWGAGRLRAPALLFGLEAVSNLLLSLWWAGRLGLRGVAWGTLVPALLVGAVWLPREALRLLGIDRGRFWREALRRPFLLSLPLALSAAGLSRLPLASWPLLGAAVGLATLLWLLLCWRWGLHREERRALLRRDAP